MEITRELAAISALNRMYGYSPVKGHALLEKYGSAAAVPGLSPEQEFAQLRWLRERGHILVSCLEEDYPPLLKETPDGPVGLYVTGVSPPREIFSYKRAIAIVGTRDITSYGAFWCRKIVQALAQTAERPVIVSGFAIGTDIIAQREALRCGLRTIGVMPCGPESIYPPRHRDTAGVLVNTEGCALVSDYPPGTGAVASNFIRRNRIIAGLADAVILIESKRRGGGLITMDFAADYGRAAYALPGRLEDPCSEGCNNLIRRNKAALLMQPSEVADSLRWRESHNGKPDSPALTLPLDLTEQERKVYEEIVSNDAPDADTLMLLTGFSVPELSAILLSLECKSVVRCVAGQRYRQV